MDANGRFFLVSGASGSGKSSIRGLLQDRLGFPWHDFDSIEMPKPIPRGWRHRSVEEWVRRAVREGGDFGLCGQIAYGEILAAPSASDLSAVFACTLDCSDKERIHRLVGRGETPDEDKLRWAKWLRRHAVDPTHAQFVITRASDEDMRWERWTSLPAGHDSWRCPVFDTTNQTLDDVALQVAGWVRVSRRRADS